MGSLRRIKKACKSGHPIPARPQAGGGSERIELDRCELEAIQMYSRADFQRELVAGVDRFCSCLSEHLSFEDGLLWPIALVVIDDPAVWRAMKTVCDEIGYCGIHVA